MKICLIQDYRQSNLCITIHTLLTYTLPGSPHEASEHQSPSSKHLNHTDRFTDYRFWISPRYGVVEWKYKWNHAKAQIYIYYVFSECVSNIYWRIIAWAGACENIETTTNATK